VKKILISLVVLVMVVTLILGGCAPSTPTPAPTPSPTPSPTPAPTQEVIELTFANFMPPVTVASKAWEEFCKALESRTDGRVKVTYIPGGALLDGPRMADGITTGIADMGWMMVAYTPGRYPVTSIIEMPLKSPSGWVVTHAANDFFKKYTVKEWDEVHPLVFFSTGPSVIYSNKPVRKMEDMKGLILRAVGSAGAMCSLLGGTPDSLPATEVYDAVLKGVINGALMPYEAAPGWRYYEVCDYVTDCWQAGSQAPFEVVMNKNTWNKLPPDIQAVVTEVSEEWIDKMAVVMNDADVAGIEVCKKAGVETIELSPEEGDRWNKTCQPVIDKYISGLVERGYTEQEAKGFVDYMSERIAYWTQQQIEKGIKSPTGPPELR